MRLPDIMASLDGIAPHVPSLHISISCYQDHDFKTYLCSPLCRFTSPTPTPIILRSASAHTPPLSLISFPVLSATSLQQDVCRGLILGYNRRYFISYSFCPNVMFHFANSLNPCWCWHRVMFSVPFPYFTRALAELFFRVWKSRRLHHRSGR
jgi:hypothetical protein